MYQNDVVALQTMQNASREVREDAEADAIENCQWRLLSALPDELAWIIARNLADCAEYKGYLKSVIDEEQDYD